MTTVKWAVVVFILVEGALLYAIWKFRGRPGDAEPEQTHGNAIVEVVWTIIPAAILAFIAVPTVRTIFLTAEIPAGAMEVEVIGHQWWWEFRYPEQKIVTANEMVVAAGRARGREDPDRRRAARLLGAAVRRQARRLPPEVHHASGSPPIRWVPSPASAPSSAASSTGGWGFAGGGEDPGRIRPVGRDPAGRVAAHQQRRGRRRHHHAGRSRRGAGQVRARQRDGPGPARLHGRRMHRLSRDGRHADGGHSRRCRART